MSKTRFAAVICLSQLAATLSACGGGSGTADTITPVPPLGESPTPSTPTVEGVAMPSSVAVVTATNTP